MKRRETRRKPASRAMWKSRFDDWKKSGLSQIKYCKQNNLKPSSFYNWNYIFRQSPKSKEAKTKSTTVEATFIPVNINRSPSELVLRCGEISLHCADTVPAD